VLSINVVDYPFNFQQTQTAIVSPNRMHLVLAAVAKILVEKKSATVSTQIKALLETIKPIAEAHVFAEQLLAGKKIAILLGAVAHNHPQASVIRSLAQLIAQLTGATCGYLTEGANSAGAWIAGAIPHRTAAGVATEMEMGMTANEALAANLRAYVLYNVEPPLDCADAHVAAQAMQQADFVVAFSPFAADIYLKHADVILPIAAFTENEGSYVNAEGRWQDFTAIVAPPGEVRPGWKVLRVLANQLKVPDIEYDSVEQIRTEIKTLAAKADVQTSWYCPSTLTATQYPLTRITEWPIYSVDSLVRRSAALQASATNHPTGIYMHANLAQQLNVKEGSVVTAKQGQGQAQLSVIIDTRLPQDCVWIPAGRHETAQLGVAFGEIEIHAK
jgi:NADH-quinone oxidoreductase subunit G